MNEVGDSAKDGLFLPVWFYKVVPGVADFCGVLKARDSHCLIDAISTTHVAQVRPVHSHSQ